MNEKLIAELRLKIQDEGNNILDEILANPKMEPSIKQRKLIVVQLLVSFTTILGKIRL